jgi:UDP-N-acetylmuramoyl-L-alanyl-D-glutamate--2,6-diaminopimelate ligase
VPTPDAPLFLPAHVAPRGLHGLVDHLGPDARLVEPVSAAATRSGGTGAAVRRVRGPAAHPVADGATLTAEPVLLTGVSLRTNELRPGDLFVALPGAVSHGAQHAGAARAAGAVAILTDERGAALAGPAGLPVVVVSDPRRSLGRTAAWVYRTAEHPPLLAGVTGTNGKTSTVHLLEALMRRLGHVAGLSATTERRIAGDALPSRLSTPEASEMHALLAAMRERDVSAVAVEVSAQAMSKHRVDGILFDVVGFTNLTHDHLDEYADMSEYYAAKRMLFGPEHARHGVVSLDSPFGARLAAESAIPVTTIASRPAAGDREAGGGTPGVDMRPDWQVTVLDEQPGATAFRLEGPSGELLETRIPLIGRHMAADAGLAIVMLVSAGVPFDRIADALRGAPLDVHVPGRSERVAGSRGPRVYLDIAHTPDAFLNTATAVRGFTTGRVLMIVGADGDRDATKRYDMGRLSSELSDVMIVTDHHARFEDPAGIRADLLSGARAAATPATLFEISEPPAAIRHAVSLAGDDDTILWVGPGLTPYRDVRGELVPYSSFEDARAALEEYGWG